MGSEELKVMTIEDVDDDDDDKEEERESGRKAIIDPKRRRYPWCIVWSPLPVVSWFIPCIGHIGICREDGVILDFAGPNFVSVDHFTFGAPTRYIQLTKPQCFSLLDTPTTHHSSQGGSSSSSNNNNNNNIEIEITRWDDALRKSTLQYQHHSYNIFTCNCHSFVSNCLNNLKFLSGGWNVVNLALLMFLKGRFVSNLAALRTYLPFILVASIGFAIGGLTFFAYLALFFFILLAWFLLATYCFTNAIRV